MKQTASVRIARILSWIIAGVLLLLPFHALLTTWIGSNTGYLDLIRIWKDLLIVLMLPFVLWLAFAKPKIKQWLLNSWLARLCVAYGLIHFIFGLWAYKHGQVNSTALIYALIINLRFIYFFVVCAVVVSYSDVLKKYWANIVLWPAVIVVFFGLLQKFALPYDFLKHFGYGPKSIPVYQTVDSNLDYQRIQSSLRGANPLGAYLVLTITAGFAILRQKRFLLTIFLVASAVTMYFSYSRSAWIGLALALSTLAWLMFPKKHLERLALPALIVIGVVGLGLYLARSNQVVQDSIFHTSSNSTVALSSNESRAAALKAGFSDVYNQPQGSGPGTAGPASFRNDHPARIAENYYLQIGQETGVIGMMIFIAIVVLVTRELWLRRSDMLAQVLLASLVGISFVNLVSHAWTDDTISLLWWGFAGVAIGTPAAKSLKLIAKSQTKKK